MSVPRGHFKFWCCYSKFIPKFAWIHFCLLLVSCLDSVLTFCLLHSAIILPRFHIYVLSFCILWLSWLDSMLAFCLLPSVIILPLFRVEHSAIILPRFHIYILSFAFCDYLASIPYLFSGWISVPGGNCNIFYVYILCSRGDWTWGHVLINRATIFEKKIGPKWI